MYMAIVMVTIMVVRDMVMDMITIDMEDMEREEAMVMVIDMKTIMEVTDMDMTTIDMVDMVVPYMENNIFKAMEYNSFNSNYLFVNLKYNF